MFTSVHELGYVVDLIITRDDIIHLIPIGEYYRQVTVIHTIKQLARHALHQTNHFFVNPPSKEASRYEEPEMALGNQMRRSK